MRTRPNPSRRRQNKGGSSDREFFANALIKISVFNIGDAAAKKIHALTRIYSESPWVGKDGKPDCEFRFDSNSRCVEMLAGDNLKKGQLQAFEHYVQALCAKLLSDKNPDLNIYGVEATVSFGRMVFYDRV